MNRNDHIDSVEFSGTIMTLTGSLFRSLRRLSKDDEGIDVKRPTQLNFKRAKARRKGKLQREARKVNHGRSQ